MGQTAEIFDFTPEAKARAIAFLKEVGGAAPGVLQNNLERRDGRWRLRFRQRDPVIGRVIRRAALLPGTPEEVEAMVRFLRPACAFVCRGRQEDRAAWRAAESEAKACRVALRRLRAQVVADAVGGERRRRALGRAFDAAVLVGPQMLTWLLREGPAAVRSLQTDQDVAVDGRSPADEGE